MGSVYFILVFVCVVSFYAYCNLSLKRDYIQCVEAGNSNEANYEEQKELSYYAPHRMIKDDNGRMIDAQNMMQVKVNGDCMAPIGINSGDILLVKKIDKNEDIDKVITKGDVLLIYLSDKRIYKLRAFDSYEDSEKSVLKTYRYDDNKIRKDSSKSHNRKNIIGVVEYNLSVR